MRTAAAFGHMHTLERVACVALSVLIVSTILYLARTVLPGTAITTDEHSYLMQAHQFAAGKLRYPYPGDHLHDFVWHRLSMVICDREHGWFSRYPPGHALWLVPGVMAGAPYVMPLFAAAASLAFLAGAARLMGISRLLILYLFACSPFFLFMHATLLSHTTAFAAVCAMLYGYVRWFHQRGASGWMVFSGLSWSYLYMTRPFTAFLIGLLFGLHAVAVLAGSWRDRAAWRGVLLFAGSAGVGIVLTLLYNVIMLGNPFTAPYFFFKPEETLGFGPGSMDHTAAMGRRQFFDNLLLWDRWMWGVPLTLPILIVLVVIGWQWVWTPMFMAIFAAFWAGYFFFHYPGPHEIGPGYYFEALPFVMLACAMGIQRLVGAGWRTPVRLAIGIAMLIALPCFMLPFSRARIAELKAEFHERTTLYRLLREAPPRALIFFNHMGIDAMHYDNDSMLMYYPRGLESDPLVLPNYHEGAGVLARLFPERDVYLLHADSMEDLRLERWTPKDVIDPDMAIDRFALGVGANTIDAQGRLVRTAREAQVGGLIAYGAYRLLPPGRYAVAFDVEVRGDSAQPGAPVITLDVSGDLGRTQCWKQDVDGGGAQTVRGEFTIDRYTQVEPRVYYHGRGHATLSGVRLQAAGP